MNSAPRSFYIEGVSISVCPSKIALGQAAAGRAAAIIQRAIDMTGRARILVATGNSQLEMMSCLAADQTVAWSKVEAFHLDEYVGLSQIHPASFRHWIRTRFAEKARPAQMHYINGDAPDLDAVLRDYAAALASGPLDLAFVGFGENAHIAFNDPHVADFNDPALIKRVMLDQACREQQVGEGHFQRLDQVPEEAITITCSGLMRARYWICCVPDRRKARAVRGAFRGSISPLCPATLVRRHPNAFVYLDPASAELLLRESENSHAVG